MKPFTMAILAVGITTLVFYALNPLEPFETSTGQTQTPLDLQTLIAKYRSMTAAEREQLRYEIHQRRNQLGLVDSGFFDQGLHPELKQSMPPGSDSEKPQKPETAEADAAEAAVNNKMTKQAKAIMRLLLRNL
jgi:hypothetical protein